jgi:chemotaxis protein CheD
MIIGKKNGNIVEEDVSSSSQIIKGFPTHTIIGGEFAIVKDSDNIAFKTLLGSCVAIMFYDKELKLKAMNHFLLPKTTSAIYDMKYGLYSVETMLNEMYKLGCKKENITAKISGGANIVGLDISSYSIGQRNVEFAMDFCNAEGFKVISNHTLGAKSRVVLLTNNFETYIKTLDNTNKTKDVVDEEVKLQREISIPKTIYNSTQIELF